MNVSPNVGIPNETRMILDALRRRHELPRNGTSRAWIFAEEVRVGTGFRMVPGDVAGDAIRLGQEQRIDAFALNVWPSHRFRRVAYEVKVTLSDLRRELQQKYKAEAALALANEFYLVAPVGILTERIMVEIPQRWGILSYNGQGLRRVRRPQWHDAELPPFTFMLSLLRNLQQRSDGLDIR